MKWYIVFEDRILLEQKSYREAREWCRYVYKDWRRHPDFHRLGKHFYKYDHYDVIDKKHITLYIIAEDVVEEQKMDWMVKKWEQECRTKG